MKTCSNCRYYSATMYCVRHAPIENEKTHDRFPRVSGSSYCGDWENEDSTKYSVMIINTVISVIKDVEEEMRQNLIDGYYKIPIERWDDFKTSSLRILENALCYLGKYDI